MIRPSSFWRVVAVALLTFTFCWLGTTPAVAQPFPTRPVRIVIPFAAGGTTDVAARRIAEFLRARWNQGVVVENRTGAGTIIATQLVARSAPDGTTVLLTDFALATNEVLYAQLPYELRQLASVTTLVTWPLGIAVNANLGVDSLQALAALARTRPLNYGSFGPGTAPHLAMELFKAIAGIDFLHVPYNGIAPVLLAMNADTLQATVMGVGAAIPGVQRGTIRMLALDSRSPLLPEVPSFAEAGFPDMRAPAWWGVAVPAGTDSDIVAELNRGIVESLQDPTLRNYLLQGGYTPVGDSPAAFGERIRDTIELWRPIARRANIVLN